MEALTATKLSEGKFQIVRGAEVLGSVDIPESRVSDRRSPMAPIDRGHESDPSPG